MLDVAPPHLSDVAAFTLATGLRAANVTGLQWTQVDLVRRLAWVHADQAKARKALPVPLNAEAVVLIRKWLIKHPTYVFSFRGKPDHAAKPIAGKTLQPPTCPCSDNLCHLRASIGVRN